jgi:putative ABC transport system ATP-binding protein
MLTVMGHALVQLENISKRYSAERSILDALQFELHAGECVAIFGPSGSGKTTFLNVLGLIVAPDSGLYRLAGEEIDYLSEAVLLTARREEIGFIFQHFRLLQRLTAYENVSLPLLLRGTSFRSSIDVVRQVLERLGVAYTADQYPETLSGGESQRVAIARAIVSEPSIIIADEPTGNLDHKSGKRVLMELARLRDEGKAIVMATHSVEAAAIADRVLHLREGKLVPQ